MRLRNAGTVDAPNSTNLTLTQPPSLNAMLGARVGGLFACFSLVRFHAVLLLTDA